MKTLLLLFLLLMMINSCHQSHSDARSQVTQSQIKYPVTKKVPVIEEHYRVRIEDPYRWLEDTTSVDTKEWIKAQNKLTADYLKNVPYRDKIKARLVELFNDKVLPIANMDQGTDSIEFSEDGKYMIYVTLSFRKEEIFVKNRETGQLLNDRIVGTHFTGPAWYDNGFYYTDRNNLGVFKVCYHKLGASQTQDQMIYSTFDVSDIHFLYLEPQFSNDSRFLFLSFDTFVEEKHSPLEIIDLWSKDHRVIHIDVPDEDTEDKVYVDGNIGDDIYIHTDSLSIKFNKNKPEQKYWIDAVFKMPRKDYLRDSTRRALRSAIKFASKKQNYAVDTMNFKIIKGTLNSLFLIHKNKLKKNGGNPTVMCLDTERYKMELLENPLIYLFLDQGGILAFLFLETEDKVSGFIENAEYLISEGYTSAQKLACVGMTNGDALVARVINQRPDLFKVVLPSAGFTDLLYGKKYSPVDIETSISTIDNVTIKRFVREEFDSLYQQSPYHQLTKGVRYPATLIWAGDSLSIPAFKYIARMQEFNADSLPALIKINSKTNPNLQDELIDRYTDYFSFLFYHLGVKMK